MARAWPDGKAALSILAVLKPRDVERFRRFISVDAETGCWHWTGSRQRSGYGQMAVRDGKAVYHVLYAHRVSYEMHRGPIPPGLSLDHLCRVRHCVNPDHLEPVTSRENTLRGMSPPIVTFRTGVCRKGHSMQDAMVSRGKRRCRQCNLEWQRKARRARRVESSTEAHPS